MEGSLSAQTFPKEGHKKQTSPQSGGDRKQTPIKNTLTKQQNTNEASLLSQKENQIKLLKQEVNNLKQKLNQAENLQAQHLKKLEAFIYDHKLLIKINDESKRMCNSQNHIINGQKETIRGQDEKIKLQKNLIESLQSEVQVQKETIKKHEKSSNGHPNKINGVEIMQNIAQKLEVAQQNSKKQGRKNKQQQTIDQRKKSVNVQTQIQENVGKNKRKKSIQKQNQKTKVKLPKSTTSNDETSSKLLKEDTKENKIDWTPKFKRKDLKKEQQQKKSLKNKPPHSTTGKEKFKNPDIQFLAQVFNQKEKLKDYVNEELPIMEVLEHMKHFFHTNYFYENVKNATNFDNYAGVKKFFQSALLNQLKKGWSLELVKVMETFRLDTLVNIIQNENTIENTKEFESLYAPQVEFFDDLKTSMLEMVQLEDQTVIDEINANLKEIMVLMSSKTLNHLERQSLFKFLQTFNVNMQVLDINLQTWSKKEISQFFNALKTKQGKKIQMTKLSVSPSRLPSIDDVISSLPTMGKFFEIDVICVNQSDFGVDAVKGEFCTRLHDALDEYEKLHQNQKLVIKISVGEELPLCRILGVMETTYTRKQLMKLRQHPLSRIKPSCLLQDQIPAILIPTTAVQHA